MRRQSKGESREGSSESSETLGLYPSAYAAQACQLCIAPLNKHSPLLHSYIAMDLGFDSDSFTIGKTVTCAGKNVLEVGISQGITVVITLEYAGGGDF